MWSWDPPYPFSGLGALLGGRLFEAAERQAHGGREDGINGLRVGAHKSVNNGVDPGLPGEQLVELGDGWDVAGSTRDRRRRSAAQSHRFACWAGKAGGGRGPPKKSRGRPHFFQI